MDVRYEARPDHLHVVVGGEFDPARARGALGEILRECQARNLTRILVDGRTIVTAVSVADRYDLATQLATFQPGRVRIAIVVSEENMFSKTLENTAANRGAAVRTTASMGEARAFLGLAGPPSDR